MLVNNVMPGPIETERLRALVGDADALRQRGEEIPVGRVGQPEEVGDVVAFLASDRASFVNGVSLLVDGGEAHVIA